MTSADRPGGRRPSTRAHTSHLDQHYPLSMSASSSSADPTAPAPVVVHFLSDSRAESILWLLEELAVDYRIHYWRREPNMLAPKGLRQIHPLGKSPVIEHGNKVVAETGNLIAYLLHRAFPSETTAAFTQFPTEDARETDSYFLFYVEGSLMPILVNKLVFSKFPAMSPWYIRPIISSFASSVDKMWLDRQLVTHLAMVRDLALAEPKPSAVAAWPLTRDVAPRPARSMTFSRSRRPAGSPAVPSRPEPILPSSSRSTSSRPAGGATSPALTRSRPGSIASRPGRRSRRRLRSSPRLRRRTTLACTPWRARALRRRRRRSLSSKPVDRPAALFVVQLQPANSASLLSLASPAASPSICHSVDGQALIHIGLCPVWSAPRRGCRPSPASPVLGLVRSMTITPLSAL